MANKYSKSNISTKEKEKKTMQHYEERRNKLNTTARVIAIVMIIALVVTFTLFSSAFLFDQRDNSGIINAFVLSIFQKAEGNSYGL